MKKENKWTFKNELVIKEGLDPRQELNAFVNGYYSYITAENKQNIFHTYKLSGRNDEEKIEEFVNNIENEWTEIWNRIVHAWNNEQTFPKHDMFQRMVVFFEEFLKVLVNEKIYTRVIVMQYHKFDKYGSHTIHAIDDAGKDADFVYVFLIHLNNITIKLEPTLLVFLRRLC